MSKSSVVLVWLAALSMAQCSGWCGGGGGGARPKGFNSGPEVPLSFPSDHRLHQDAIYKSEASTEWLYFTGITTMQGSERLFGYEFVLFQYYSAEHGRFYYAIDMAISDVQDGRFFFDSFELLGAPKMRTAPGNREPVWVFKQGAVRIWHREQSDVWEIAVSNGKSGNREISLNLTLANRAHGYYRETKSGIIEMGDCEVGTLEDMIGLSYYYSHPQLETRGTLSAAGETVQVSGYSWFDHQWGNFSQCSGWDWFSLRFEDSSYLMVFNFNRSGNNRMPVPDKLAAAYFAPDGKKTYWSAADGVSIEPLASVRSAAQGSEYQVEWLVTTPLGKLHIKPLIENQILEVSEQPYYEGIVEVREDGPTGQVAGLGYLETTPK
jgi:predicted secreted hydrolase